MSMTNPSDRIEVITSVQRRRRWWASEKVRMVEETFEPSMTVSVVARRHGVAPTAVHVASPCCARRTDGCRQRPHESIGRQERPSSDQDGFKPIKISSRIRSKYSHHVRKSC